MQRTRPSYKVYSALLDPTLLYRDMPNIPVWYNVESIAHDVKKNGFLNPILVQCGWIRKHAYLDPSYLAVDCLGGTRLIVAKTLNVVVPCVISDFIGRFVGGELLSDEPAVMSKFTHKPKQVEFRPNGLVTSPPDDYRDWL